mmetsp:Transcript_21917/g.60677  ORF Transcript_21917/g.60677 Transcript_21917/m.60677 type:complete len:203 (-) Transcript_21917:264-872(-)
MRTVRQGAPVHSYCTTRNDEVAAHKLGQSLMGAGQSDQQLQQRTLSIPCPPAASMHTLVEPRHLYCYSMHLSPHPCILWSSLNNSTATACTSTHQAQPPFSHGCNRFGWRTLSLLFSCSNLLISCPTPCVVQVPPGLTWQQLQCHLRQQQARCPGPRHGHQTKPAQPRWWRPLCMPPRAGASVKGGGGRGGPADYLPHSSSC